MSGPRRCWVAITLVDGIGSVRFGGLLVHFGEAQSIWNAPARALRQAGLSSKIYKNLLEVRSSISLDQV